MNETYKERAIRFLKSEISIPDNTYGEGYNDGISLCIKSMENIPEIPYFYLLKKETQTTVIDMVKCLYESQVSNEK